jgi:hypothetical protein
MPDAIAIQICQACGAPSTAGISHDLGQGDVHELCGQCLDVSDAVSHLGSPDGAAGYAARRARVARILDLLDRADEVCGG